MTRRPRLSGFAALLALLWLAIAGTATAQTVIEKLVSPGPLAAAHARYEANCKTCHQAFDKKAQSQQCLDCHKPIAADLAARTGFHGRSREIPGAECKTCHTDHAGRGARLVRLDPRSFNHALTDYPLHGAHARVACASCHAPGAKFRAAPTACVACHRKTDPHKGALGAACADCHVETGWKDVRFDHAKTAFPLVGAHARATCASCHADKAFQGAPTACASCHAKQDVHRGSLGPACGSCHSPAGWTPARFDHARTGFALVGAHARAECEDCHTKGRYQDAKPACASCHKKDDVHAGKYGAGCADCHGSRDWKVSRFDHGRTGFALTGGHADLTCGACHAPSPAKSKPPATACAGCHAKDDVHKGRNGPDCGQCHTSADWKKTSFDHAKTRFPLRGGHAKAACVACHVQPPGVVKLSLACNSCHQKDDPHAGQLGPDCASCHADTSWTRPVRFDHGIAAFPLVGKHGAVACAGCHQTKRYKDAPTACADCHRKEDPHRGAYRLDCAACHNPAGWPNWSFDHAKTRFPIDGRHVGLACDTCHRPGRPRPSSSCASCHQSDDVHNGAFGPACDQCHTTESFHGARPSL